MSSKDSAATIPLRHCVIKSGMPRCCTAYYWHYANNNNVQEIVCAVYWIHNSLVSLCVCEGVCTCVCGTSIIISAQYIIPLKSVWSDHNPGSAYSPLLHLRGCSPNWHYEDSAEIHRQLLQQKTNVNTHKFRAKYTASPRLINIHIN